MHVYLTRRKSAMRKFADECGIALVEPIPVRFKRNAWALPVSDAVYARTPMLALEAHNVRVRIMDDAQWEQAQRQRMVWELERSGFAGALPEPEDE